MTLQATVTSQGGAPKGTVSFQDGNTQLGTATLDANGNASFSASGLALGAHAIAAYYLVIDPYYPSQSASSTVTVYANAPRLVTFPVRSQSVCFLWNHFFARNIASELGVRAGGDCQFHLHRTTSRYEL